MKFALVMPKKRRSAEGFVRATEQSPVGEIAVVCSDRGLREVTVRPRREPARGRNRSASPRAETSSSQSRTKAGAMLARQALAEIGEYLAGRRRQFAIPLDLAGSPFQLKVWKALRAIPYGETRSYGEIRSEERRVGKECRL